MWNINFSSRAEKFLSINRFPKETVFDLLGKAVCKFHGEAVNINLKALKGEWRGFYRIRKGELRIIASFNFNKSAIHVEVIDWRGNAY